MEGGWEEGWMMEGCALGIRKEEGSAVVEEVREESDAAEMSVGGCP